MLIHVIGSLRNFEDDTPYIQAIFDTVQSHGHQIALNWFCAVKDRRERKSRAEESFDWNEIVENNIEATTSADALIVEGSRFNYSQGYQTAVALAHNKPVLNLYRKDQPEYIQWPDKFFVSGVRHPLFHSAPYQNGKDLQAIVVNFLDEITPKTVNLEVNLTIDQDVAKYLSDLSYQTGRNKNGIIKDILKEKARESL